jgi:hypothetical protein
MNKTVAVQKEKMNFSLVDQKQIPAANRGGERGNPMD